MTGDISPRGVPAGHWTLDHDGRRLRVETARAGWDRVVRLSVDGEPAGEVTTGRLRVTLPCGEWSVVVAFDALGLVDGQAARCELAPPAPDDGGDGGGPGRGGPPRGIAFAPAEGTRAARREALARAHPALYASRHVAAAAAKAAFPLLGLGALVKVLLELVPRPDVRFPDVDPPSIPWPDVPWPGAPDLSVPPWLAAVLATTKFWVPILIAVAVAARETRRRGRASAEAAAQPDGVPADGVPAGDVPAGDVPAGDVPAGERGPAERRPAGG